jgi:hypothetical protein
MDYFTCLQFTVPSSSYSYVRKAGGRFPRTVENCCTAVFYKKYSITGIYRSYRVSQVPLVPGSYRKVSNPPQILKILGFNQFF